MMENKTKIDLKNKSIFITGVAGFIGSNLAKRLLSTVEGVKVVGLDNMNNYYDVRLKEARLKELEQFEKFSFVKGNLADKAVIKSIFEQYKPEIVVNLGAQAGVRYSITNPDAYVEANLIGFYIGEMKIGSTEFAMQLLREKHVAVVPGIAYGDDFDASFVDRELSLQISCLQPFYGVVIVL